MEFAMINLPGLLGKRTMSALGVDTYESDGLSWRSRSLLYQSGFPLLF